MNRRRLAIFFALAVCGVAAITASTRARETAEAQFRSEVEAARKFVEQMPKPDVVSEAVVGAGATFSKVLAELGLDSTLAYAIVEAANPVFNLRRLRHGNKVLLARSAEGELRSIRYNIDPDRELWITPESGGFRAEIQEVPSRIEVVGLRGELRSSLFESVLEIGESPDLAVRLAEIFAWDLDFYRDPQPGDTFRMVLEKKQYQNGGQPGYGRILLAEYNNAGRVYTAVLFRDPSGRPAYYSAEGKSLQKAFLRSPLKFAARISSHFSRSRLHPVLGVRRPHLGTDYAAPTGTPVQSVADGKVIWAGPKGGNGILVGIAHMRGYHSYYLHLSRALVRRGQSVRQGQIIGRVGSTGLASGPHLDFRLQRGREFVNWERMQLPPAQPVAENEMAAFLAERDRWTPLLPADGQNALASVQQDTEADAAGAVGGAK